MKIGRITLKRLVALFLALTIVTLSIQGVLVANAQVAYEPELVIISPHAKPILDSFKTAFEAYAKDVLKTTVKVSYSFYSSEDCYKLAKEWAGKPKADIWWGGGIDLFVKATGEDLLMAYKCKDWDKIPADWFGLPAKCPGGHWTGYALSGFGFAYNLDYLKKYGLAEPTKWSDLLNPAYRGHIVMCTPTRSSSTHTMIEIVLQGMSEDPGLAYLRKMAVNVGLFTARSQDVIDDVNEGEHGVGLVVDYYGFESTVAGYLVKLNYPVDYALANPDYIAILGGCPHPEIAKAFLDYVLSDEGQKLSMGIEQRGVKCSSPRLPIRPGLSLPSYLPDVTKQKMIKYDGTLANGRWEIVNTIYENTIEKKQAELKDAWGAIETARTTLEGLKAKGYTVDEGLSKLVAAEASFGKGDYAKAKSDAEASSGLAKQPQPLYTLYATVGVILLIIILGAYYLYRKRPKA